MSGDGGELGELNGGQKRAMESALGGDSMLVTGRAGTGKSFLVKRMIEELRKKEKMVVVTASTGIAAVNIGGTTLHSFVGGGLNPNPERAARGMTDVWANQWRRTDVLIIDECSMIDSDYFEKASKIGSLVRENDKPFGGMQIIMVGDFFQLPPYKGKFIFEVDLFKEIVGEHIYELREQFRQTDPEYVQFLEKIRFGNIDKSVKATWLRLSEKASPPDDAVWFFPRTVDVARRNIEKFRQLEGEERIFKSTDSNPTLKSWPVEEEVNLKVGAKVLLRKNLSVRNGLVNGAFGEVTSFGNDGYPMVRFASGVTMIGNAVFELMMGDEVIATRSQIPLMLAYALTVHKTQGLSLDEVVIDLTRSFGHGMIYTALSRARTLDGMWLRGKMPSMEMMKPDPRVVTWWKENVKENDEEVEIDKLEPPEIVPMEVTEEEEEEEAVLTPGEEVVVTPEEEESHIKYTKQHALEPPKGRKLVPYSKDFDFDRVNFELIGNYDFPAILKTKAMSRQAAMRLDIHTEERYMKALNYLRKRDNEQETPESVWYDQFKNCYRMRMSRPSDLPVDDVIGVPIIIREGLKEAGLERREWLPYVPPNLKLEVIDQYIANPLRLKMSASSLFRNLERLCVGIRLVDATEYIEASELHQVRKNVKIRKIIMPQGEKWPHHQFELDLMDFSKNADVGKGTNYVLTIVDVFTKKARCWPLHQKGAQTILKSAKDYLLEESEKGKLWTTQKFIVHSDNGGEFRGVFEKWIKENDWDVRKGLPYRAWSQGAVERLQRNLKTIVFAAMDLTNETFVYEIEKVVQNYNNTIHTATKMTPNDLAELTDLRNGDRKKIVDAKKVVETIVARNEARKSVAWRAYNEDKDKIRVGDFVRRLEDRTSKNVRTVKPRSAFTKKWNGNWSKDIWFVEKITEQPLRMPVYQLRRVMWDPNTPFDHTRLIKDPLSTKTHHENNPANLLKIKFSLTKLATIAAANGLVINQKEFLPIGKRPPPKDKEPEKVVRFVETNETIEPNEEETEEGVKEPRTMDGMLSETDVLNIIIYINNNVPGSAVLLLNDDKFSKSALAAVPYVTHRVTKDLEETRRMWPSFLFEHMNTFFLFLELFPELQEDKKASGYHYESVCGVLNINNEHYVSFNIRSSAGGRPPYHLMLIDSLEVPKINPRQVVGEAGEGLASVYNFWTSLQVKRKKMYGNIQIESSGLQVPHNEEEEKEVGSNNCGIFSSLTSVGAWHVLSLDEEVRRKEAPSENRHLFKAIMDKMVLLGMCEERKDGKHTYWTPNKYSDKFNPRKIREDAPQEEHEFMGEYLYNFSSWERFEEVRNDRGLENWLGKRIFGAKIHWDPVL